MAEDIDQWWIKPPAKKPVLAPAPAPMVVPAPAPIPATTSGFVTGGGRTTAAPAPAPTPAPKTSTNYDPTNWTGPVSTSASGSKPAVNTPLTQQNMSDPRIAAFWGNVNPQKPDGSNTLGGNMGQGVVNWLGFKTAQEYLDWQAENERKAALGDPNGFVAGPGGVRTVVGPSVPATGAAPSTPATGGGAGTGSGAGSGTGSAGGSTSGSGTSGSSGGLIGAATGGGQFQPWDVTPPQTVQQQAEDIIAKDSGLIQQARGRAMQQMNERGLINSSIGIQAGQDAVMDRALQIASQDAATYAENAKFNAGQGNAWNLSQQELALKDSQFKSEMEYKRWAVMQDFENSKVLKQLDNELGDLKASDAAFDNQYQMYIDLLYRIDSNPDLDAAAKTTMKNEATTNLRNYAKIRGLNLDLSNLPTFGVSGGSASSPAPAPSSGATSGSGYEGL